MPNAFYLVAFATAGIVLEIKLNRNNSREGFWLTATIVGIADIPFLLLCSAPVTWTSGRAYGGKRVLQLRPDLIVSYHSAAGLVTCGPRARALGLEAVYANAAGYAADDWSAYPVTGDFAQWAESTQRIPTIEIELPDHENTDFDANLQGLQASLLKFAN